MFRLATLLLLVASALAPVAHALVPAGVEALSISVSPRYPRPYETITVQLESTLIDLLSAESTISVNGTVMEKGLSVRSAIVTLGGPGVATRISAVVISEGQTFTKELVIRPADVSLIMEPMTTVPPFYQGAALPVSEGRLRFVALADFRTSSGARIAPENLIYTWRAGGRLLSEESGAGRSTLSATAPYLYRDNQVTVTVTSADSSLVAESAVSVTPVDPVVRIYRNDPLLGVRYEEAVSGTVTLSGDEETYRAVPYYFDSMPTLSWTINSVEQSVRPDITLRATGGGVGSAQVGISARNPGAFQSASAGLTVRFGDTESGNFFGF